MSTDWIRISLVTEASDGESPIVGFLSKLDAKRFALLSVTGQEAALQHLAAKDCDICILDLSLAGALAFLSKIQQLQLTSLTALVIVKDDSEAHEVIQEGAAGCLDRESLTFQSVQRELLLLANRIEVIQSLRAPLKESEARYRRIVDVAKEIIYRIGPTGHFSFVNPTAAAIVQRTAEDCIGLHYVSLIRKDYRKQALKFYAEQLRARNPVTYFEFPAVAVDGSEVWIGQNVQLVIENGEVVELQALGRDITARKKIEQQLLDSEQRYRLLFEANPHPMWVYDCEDYSILAVNNAAVQSYGYSAEEFLAMTLMDIRPYDEKERLARRLSEDVSNDSSETWKHRKNDGSIIDVEINGLPVTFDGKNASLITATDVTARLRAESERQVILDIIQSVNITANLDELLTFIHQSLKKILYAENCFVALHDQTTNLLHFEYWIDERDPVPAPRPVGDGFSSYVLRTGKSLSLTGEFKSQMYGRGEVKKVGTSSASWLGVPLHSPSRTIGILAVQHYENENVYTQHDIDFLSSVAGQIALAIERKRGEQDLQEANQRALTDYEKLLRRLATLAESFGTARDLTTIAPRFHVPLREA
jgi:PAS domain S-box-containing protein